MTLQLMVTTLADCALQSVKHSCPLLVCHTLYFYLVPAQCLHVPHLEAFRSTCLRQSSLQKYLKLIPFSWAHESQEEVLSFLEKAARCQRALEAMDDRSYTIPKPTVEWLRNLFPISFTKGLPAHETITKSFESPIREDAQVGSTEFASWQGTGMLLLVVQPVDHASTVAGWVDQARRKGVPVICIMPNSHPANSLIRQLCDTGQGGQS